MTRGVMAGMGRRAFLAGVGAMAACARRSTGADAGASAEASTDAGASTFALFDAFPSLARSLPRVALGSFPSAIEDASSIVDGAPAWIKRDDDFTRAESYDGSEAARLFGGGKLRKLEFFFGEARAKGARTMVTFGGVGSNQALATAILGRAFGFDVHLYLAPQPPSSLTTSNLGADAATHATMRLFSSVMEAEAQAAREAAGDATLYAIPPGGTTPLGTIGWVNAGMEIASDVRAKTIDAPKRIYVALGLGGTTTGLAIGCALAGLSTEIVAVRASNLTTVSAATLRSIHDRTVAFLRARDASFPAISFDATRVRIDGRFVGRGYGFPTAAGDDAIERARSRQGWSLDPVYTGKALAALIADADAGARDPVLFWNTASSRPVPHAAVVDPFRKFLG
jgi:D-cysteine desulfhydrase